MKITEAKLIGPKKMVFIETPVDLLDDREILVQVAACGVCTSEFPVYTGLAEKVRGVSFRYAEYPCSLGHEIVGVVVDTGKKAARFKPGDRVTGVAYRGSGYATHVIDAEDLFIHVPETVPLEYALGEPLMAVANIVRMAAPDFGDHILVVGDGFMALATVASLSHYPLRSLIVVGHHDDRLALAREFGATHIVNSHQTDAYWRARAIIDGANHDPAVTRWLGGVDIAFEFAGNMQALQLCASLCKPKKRAKLMMPAFYDTELFTIGHYLMNRGPSLIPAHPAHSLDMSGDLKRAMWALGKGMFPMDRLITHVFDLADAGSAFETAMGRKDGYIKGIVTPDPTMLEIMNTKKYPV